MINMRRLTNSSMKNSVIENSTKNSRNFRRN